MNKDGHYNEGFSENSGVKIFYRDYGPKDGDPILMVHGLGAQLAHWPIGSRRGMGPIGELRREWPRAEGAQLAN